MNKSITQATQNDKQISKSIKRFFTRFHISSALKTANAYKRKDTPVTEIFQYMFLLIFSNRSMYMSLLTGKNTPNFAKATLTWAENVILCPMMQWLRIPQLFSPDIGCCHWKAGNPMITGHLGSSFYTFLTKCLISHGYRLFKCCFKCSEQCFQITLNFQTKNQWIGECIYGCTSYYDENTTAGCIKAEHWQLNNCQILNFQGA